MPTNTYQLTEDIDGLEPGDILEVVSRYGDNFVNDLKLAATGPQNSTTIEITNEELNQIATPIKAQPAD